jgi:hypothetical protein
MVDGGWWIGRHDPIHPVLSAIHVPLSTRESPKKPFPRSVYTLESVIGPEGFMAKHTVWAVLLLFAAAGAAEAQAKHGGKLPLSHDYKAGLEEAKKEGKPVALYFTAEW